MANYLRTPGIDGESRVYIDALDLAAWLRLCGHEQAARYVETFATEIPK